MKSSPVIDLSFSGVSSGIIAGLFYYKPAGAELYTIAVPPALAIIIIVFKYLAAWLQILNYETYSAVSKLKARKKFLKSCLNDTHLSEDARRKHSEDYEKVTCAIDTCLRDQTIR